VPLLSPLEVLLVSNILRHFASNPEESVDVLTKVEVCLSKQSLTWQGMT
jgi:hypothetical protein